MLGDRHSPRGRADGDRTLASMGSRTVTTTTATSTNANANAEPLPAVDRDRRKNINAPVNTNDVKAAAEADNTQPERPPPLQLIDVVQPAPAENTAGAAPSGSIRVVVVLARATTRRVPVPRETWQERIQTRTRRRRLMTRSVEDDDRCARCSNCHCQTGPFCIPHQMRLVVPVGTI